MCRILLALLIICCSLSFQTALAHSAIKVGNTCSHKPLFYQHRCWNYPADVPGNCLLNAITFKNEAGHNKGFLVCTIDSGGGMIKCIKMTHHDQQKILTISTKTHHIVLASYKGGELGFRKAEVRITHITKKDPSCGDDPYTVARSYFQE